MSPTHGRVLIDNIDLSTVNLRSYRKHLGVVLQDDFLYEGTIKDNISFPRPSASEQEIVRAAQGAYVTEFTDRFPDGLETLIGERGVNSVEGNVSAFQLHAHYWHNPMHSMRLFNSDTESERFIQQSLATLMNNRTTLAIAHRLSTIQKADQIFGY